MTVAADARRCTRRRLSSLRVPAIVAPMFLVSGPGLVATCCREGVVGSFPTLNARTPAILDEWLVHLGEETRDGVPYAANLILHRSNARRDADLDAVVRRRVPVVITSVGSAKPVVDRIRDYGGLVLADVASLRHARSAVASGVDGLILLTAGAGGNTGWLNPFAFLAGVRTFFDGLVAVAGCLSHGYELAALKLLGADLGYLGTAFLAADESMAPGAHKDAVVGSTADDILLTDAISGMPANFIRSRLEAAGLMADGAVHKSKDAGDIHSWKDVWSAGQGVGAVRRRENVAAIIRRLETEYAQGSYLRA